MIYVYILYIKCVYEVENFIADLLHTVFIVHHQSTTDKATVYSRYHQNYIGYIHRRMG